MRYFVAKESAVSWLRISAQDVVDMNRGRVPDKFRGRDGYPKQTLSIVSAGDIQLPRRSSDSGRGHVDAISKQLDPDGIKPGILPSVMTTPRQYLAHEILSKTRTVRGDSQTLQQRWKLSSGEDLKMAANILFGVTAGLLAEHPTYSGYVVS
ncbi:hypothetical protein ON010_g10392 [Phytophthora cinnamomi]|nr:hypothetical protein ON010_g10392 [Phytophthora cinnamomi]